MGWRLELNDDPKGHVCDAATLERDGELIFDSLKEKSDSGHFRSRSNRFEDRATSWRRGTARRRICATTHSCASAAKWFWLSMLKLASGGCNSILTTVVVVSHHLDNVLAVTSLTVSLCR